MEALEYVYKVDTSLITSQPHYIPLHPIFSTIAMKSIIALTTALITVVVSKPTALKERAQPQGCDVSGYQPNINWATVKANGASFVFIKVHPIHLLVIYAPNANTT